MVLIINQTKRHASAMSEMLHIMGILAHASTPADSLSEISICYRAIIIIAPDTLPDKKDFAAKLRSYASMIPIFAISDSADCDGIFDMSFEKNTGAAVVASEIAGYQRKNGLPVIADYRLSGIDAVPSGSSISYFDRKLPFTKTETMILRYLIRSYPIPQNPKSILTHAFRPSRTPEESNIRTHISIMNKKFRNIVGRNLIVRHPDMGYIILTPEIASKSFFM